MQYQALTLLWHSQEERYVQPNEIVDLDHLSHDDIEILIGQGAVAEVIRATTEQDDATNN